jgi:hypothetical protein
MQVRQVPGLLGFVPRVVAVEPCRLGGLVDNRPAHAAAVAGPRVAAAAELGDREGLAVPEVLTQFLAEPIGVGRVPVGIGCHDVERLPVDVLPRAGRVGHRAGEALSHRGGGLGQEAVELGGQRGERGIVLLTGGLQAADAVEEVRARQEAGREQGQLGPGDQHHPGAGTPQVLGPVGAVGQQRRELAGRQFAGERGEPYLQARGRGSLGGDGQPLGVAAGYPHRGAPQL